MKSIKEVINGANYKAISVGKYSDLGEHVFVVAPGNEIPGKVFTGDALGSSIAWAAMLERMGHRTVCVVPNKFP